MFGFPINGPTNIFCVKRAVYANTKRTESTPKKNHHIIAYHQSREEFASGKVRVSKEHTPTNLDDVFTKSMAAPRREDILERFT